MAPRARTAQPIEHNLLLTAVLCLLAFGAVMVYSASSTESLLDGTGGGSGSGFLVRYVLYGAVGLVAMQVLSRRGVSVALRYTGPFLAFAFVCLVLVKVPGIGVSINGARRWLGAGPLQFQPSELMKLALLLHAVKLIAEKPKIVRTPRLLGPIFLPAGGAIVLVASQPDLGTALVITATILSLLVVAGIPMRTLMLGLGAIAVVVLLFALVEPYRRARLMTFMDPWAHSADEGFQSVQGQIALGSGGLFGVGLGQSTQKAFYLPEAHTDFILAIIGEELGVAGVMGLLCLYGLFAYAGLRIAKRAVGLYPKLLAAGLTALVLSQACLNVFTVLGLAPLTGVPLPFISYGSTNLCVMLAASGLLLNVASGATASLRAVGGTTVPGSVADASGPHRRRRDGRPRRAGVDHRRRAAG